MGVTDRALPPEFLERLARILPASEHDAVLRSFSQAKPTTFRVNTLHASVEAVRTELEGAGFQLDPVSWRPGAFMLRQGELERLQETEVYKTGKVYVQSLSSMMPALALDPQPGERILDLTAAPGSKTTQMACLMNGQGTIVANDNNRPRFYKLKANVKMQGASNVEVSLRYGESFGQRPGEFDRVLVDAPCSTEGRFYLPKPASYQFWKPRKMHEMAHKQRKLLAAGLHTLKPGGVLVYSTCTFAPEENEAVVDWALKKYAHLVSLEPITLPIQNVSPGLVGWEDRSYHPELRQAVRILPNTVMEGFFMAKLRKVPYEFTEPPAGRREARPRRGRMGA